MLRDLSGDMCGYLSKYLPRHVQQQYLPPKLRDLRHRLRLSRLFLLEVFGSVVRKGVCERWLTLRDVRFSWATRIASFRAAASVA